MEKRFLFFFVTTVLLLSCKKKPIIAPLEIDFTSSNYYTPAEIKTYKSNIKCGEAAYWEGKRIKLQGFLFSGNIDTVSKHFALYEKNNVGDPSNQAIAVYYQSKDSVVMSKKLRDNRDKHCILSATCFSQEEIIIGCIKFMKFTLVKPEDLEFK